MGLVKAAMSAMHYSGAIDLLSPLTRGSGVIFTLHHVRPEPAAAFAPNRDLQVTPEFLDAVLRLVLARGFEVLSLDQVHYRLAEGDLDRPFACFTFEDGYHDTAAHAYPIFRNHNLPFAVYIATDFPDGRGDLWWLKLERVIAAIEVVEVKMHGDWRRFECRTTAQKERAFREIHTWLRSIPETDARETVAGLCHLHDIDVSSLCRDLAMTWDEIRVLARDPLVTVGAHTRSHVALAGLPIADARLEIVESVRRIEAELGRPCRHFSYPYGDAQSVGPRDFDLVRELGMKTAVTTRKGLIHPRHAASLMALPRVALNGDLQHQRYVKVMLSGVPFALSTAIEKLPLRAFGRTAVRA
jgi:peptidoglycan/xylan/chitin deacetylase (PgdA/CDA1 family)